jgi:hypothetical protein
MKNVWRKLFKKNRALTNQHGPAKKVSVIKDSIQRDDKGRWILEKTEDAVEVFIAKLTEELSEELIEVKITGKKCKCQKKNCKCELGPTSTTAKVAVKKPVAKKPASATKAVSKAKVAKPATAKPTPKKPKSK